MAVTDRDAGRMVVLAATLFPRESAVRCSLVRDLLKAHYDPKAAEAVLREHATRNSWLDLPTLGEALEHAHRSRGAELAAVRGAATRYARKQRARSLWEQRAARRDQRETDLLLRRAGFRRVRAALRAVLAAQPWLASLRKRHGFGPTLRAMVRGELAKGELRAGAPGRQSATTERNAAR